ncbi:Hypothetical protein CINCED_3A001301 [Cinara cedri]|nr:Hypothetical protein CINCED_3A001301 [Cinara cedri]
MCSKKFLFFFPILIVLNNYKSLAQYAPPGVNPQLYQQQQQIPIQQHPPSQQNIPQQPYQQPPPPQQQQQQHQPSQHQPGHGHGSEGHQSHPQQVLHTNIAEESEHIKKHLDLPSLDTSTMSEQELQFHYFKMHDADNNNKLDGCELIKSLIHWHVQGGQDPAAQGGAPPPEKIFTDEELMQLIDPILNMDDTNFDGFIDYPEFVIAQNKANNMQKQSA